MNKYDIVHNIENFAPLNTQEVWDASGWVIDNDRQDIEKVLFALTVTDDIINQAETLGCDMIISHHPLFCVPLNYAKFNIYCAHTNLDKACGGTTDLLIKKLGFVGEKYNDFVRIVHFDTPVDINALKEKFIKISPYLRYVNNRNCKYIQTLGFCAGSGSEFIKATPCDGFVTGDLKFHTAIESEKVIFDVGHFESEIFVVELLKDLSKTEEKGVIAYEKSPFI